MRTGRTVLLVLISCLFIRCPIPITLQTFLTTDYDRAATLLNLHYQIAAKETPEKKDANYIFLSDHHKGYGPHDRFANNSQIYQELLQNVEALEEKYKLVLIGDVEEGWGFQKSNTPLIRDYHNCITNRIEEKFMDSGRFIGIYGNHDDFLRGTLLRTHQGNMVATHPAALIEVKEGNAVNMRVFITHGCQGHGLHDAGDELAAWGVFEKYNLLLGKNQPYRFASDEERWEVYQYYHVYDSIDKKDLPGKKRKNVSLERIGAIKEKYSEQERNMLKWAKEGHNDRSQDKITHLVLGHTHIAVCDSYKIDYERKFPDQAISSRFLPAENVAATPKVRLSTDFTYYNTGMACNKEMPFLVMAKGNLFYFYMNKDKGNHPFKLVKMEVNPDEVKETLIEYSQTEFMNLLKTGKEKSCV